MSTPLLIIGTIVAWCVVEAWRITHHEGSISADIQRFYRVWPTVGMLFGLTFGILLAHWFFP